MHQVQYFEIKDYFYYNVAEGTLILYIIVYLGGTSFLFVRSVHGTWCILCYPYVESKEFYRKYNRMALTS
jgi:hypothetical protein